MNGSTLPKGGILLTAQQGTRPSNPITSPIELAVTLEKLCGAKGCRFEGNEVLALRWDDAGNEVVIERFAITRVNS